MSNDTPPTHQHQQQVDYIIHELNDDQILLVHHIGNFLGTYHIILTSQNPKLDDEHYRFEHCVCGNDHPKSSLTMHNFDCSMTDIDVKSYCIECLEWIFNHRHLIPDYQIKINDMGFDIDNTNKPQKVVEIQLTDEASRRNRPNYA